MYETTENLVGWLEEFRAVTREGKYRYVFSSSQLYLIYLQGAWDTIQNQYLVGPLAEMKLPLKNMINSK